MYKFSGLIAILLLCPLHFFAQSNYKNATVVLLNQQTLNGFIDYKEWDANPSSFLFKNDDGQRSITTNDAALVTIDTFEIFERLIFTPKTSGKVKDLSEIRYGIAFKGTPDTVFAKLVTRGPLLNLYSLVDKSTTRYFFKYNKTEVVTELYYDEYFGEQDESRIATSTKFKGQLSILAHDSLAHNQQKVLNRLPNLNYTSDDLARVAELLNGVTSGNASKHSYAIKPFVGLGIQTSTARYSGDIPLATNAKTSFGFGAGVNFGFDIYTNYNIRKYKVRFEASINEANLETSAIVSPNSYSSAVYTYKHKFDQYNLTFAPQFIANIYNGKRLKFNVGAGVGLNYGIYAHNAYTGTYALYSTFQDRTYDFDFRHFYISLPVRAGVVLNNKLDIFGKFTVPLSSQTEYLYYGVDVYSFQAGINYLF